MRVWYCRFCGHRAETDDDKVAYFHHCHPPTRRRRRRYSIPEVRDTRDDFLTDVGRAIEDALGGPALREVDDA